ncbi:hypothetical protein SAY87_003648 [Trapa incisa]|uniref:Uncharacterized protein n=1 Tax=Trapa incisa TaxID=236973 RepID=A0AAN7KL92_9MYRT|nr:hypothetical protein SAY87_003648 [Trapa incisa]
MGRGEEDEGEDEEEGEEESLFKIVMIGDSAVCKSNLLSRFARDEFDLNAKVTIGVEFQTQGVEIDGKEVKAQIWDTVGQERFYDISRRSTFDSVRRWLQELNTHCDTTMAKMLVGNKCHLDSLHELSKEEGMELAQEEGLFFMETSALDSTNKRSLYSCCS